MILLYAKLYKNFNIDPFLVRFYLRFLILFGGILLLAGVLELFAFCFKFSRFQKSSKRTQHRALRE